MRRLPYRRRVDGLDPGFCFYDDPTVPRGEDADKYSALLRSAHQRLWSKRLPSGERLELGADLTVRSPASVGALRLSSDTIASDHASYQRCGTDALARALPKEERRRYSRVFYTIGAFIVFPRHSNSLNQRRGTSPLINDRFDLTLECIRLYYGGITAPARNPLGDVLLADASFFDLFGAGTAGFDSYVDFFCLSDLVADGRVQWFDDDACSEWTFTAPKMPRTLDAYIRYLDNVLAFVSSRSVQLTQAAALRD